MKEKFNGKWILITNCNYTPYRELLGGIPVAVADTIYEGRSDGFYSKFRTPEYAPRTDRDFNYDNQPGLLAFFEVVKTDGDDSVAGD